MKNIIIIVFALISFAASARTLEIKNKTYHKVVKVDLVADFGDGVEQIEKYIYPEMSFLTQFNGSADIKIATKEGFVYCEGFDYNSMENILIKLNADGSCYISKR